MSAPAQDAIWKALADPTRRAMLDVLREGPRTTGALCRRFRRLSRCGVMKHLGILEKAGLVVVRRKGRFRWNYFNSTPIRQIYDREMKLLIDS
ncbi:MAG: helix-turn-helix domain-containing protein [Acidobacteriia bacterium]|nr:helix-turn-helix domain-containing protein [Terriglobia bacterium]